MGSTTIGVSPDEVKTLVCGWSATKQIFGKPVYSDQDERLDEVEGRKVGLAMLVIDMQSSVGLSEVPPIPWTRSSRASTYCALRPPKPPSP